REQLRDDADVVFRDVDREPLDGLAELAVDLACDDLRLADGQLVALAAHDLHEHGELQLAAALNLPYPGPPTPLRLAHAQRDVADQLLLEPVEHLAGGELVAVL